MNRGIAVGNKICAKWDEQRRHRMHHERIRNMRPQTDTKEPYALQMDHIRNNLKREQMLEERYSEIDRENRILLKKMSDIMKSQNTPRTNEQNQSGPQSLNRDFRKKELLRITKENQHILRRIQEAQPIYNHIQWEAEHRKNRDYVNNCAEYPRVLISRRDLTPRSELVPLQGDEADEHVPTVARSGVPQDSLPAIDSGTEGAVRSVLKESRRIGETDYLVEMSTDGRALFISAALEDKQICLELLIKDQQHRRLFRETNGDYQLLAQRLRIASSDGSMKLLLEDSEVPAAASMPASARGAAASPHSARGPASSPPTARVEGGRAAKAAEGVRERAAMYLEMEQAVGLKSPSPAATSPSPLRTSPGAKDQEHAKAIAPKAPSGKKSGRPAGVYGKSKGGTGEELDADALVTRRSDGDESDPIASQAATVYSAGFDVGTMPNSAGDSAGSAVMCEVDFNKIGGPQVLLRGFTPDRHAPPPSNAPPQ